MSADTEVALPDPTSDEFAVDPSLPDDTEEEIGDVTTASAPVVTDEPAPEPEEEPVDFAFDVHGQLQPVAGAKFLAGKRQISLADERAVIAMQSQLRDGYLHRTKYRDEYRQTQRDLKQAREERVAEVESAKVFEAEFINLLTLEMSDQQTLDYVNALRQNLPVLQERAKVARLEAEVQRAKAGPVPDEPDIEELTEYGSQTLTAWVEEVTKATPWATQEIRKEIAGVLAQRRNLGQIVRKADRDLPQWGVKAGQWHCDFDVASEIAETLAKPYQRAHEAAQAASKSAADAVKGLGAVAKTNATILGKATPATPPKKPAAPSPRSDPDVSPEVAAQRASRAKIRALEESMGIRL